MSAKKNPNEPLDVLLETASPDRFRTWLSTCLVAGGMLLIGALGLFWICFGGQVFSKDPQDWAHFGDYFGGTAGPPLAFLTVVLLVVTLALQIKQLEDSREQLKASQAELERSREHQVAMARAMSQQAHYAKISARAVALGTAMEAANQLVKARQFVVEGSIDRQQDAEFVELVALRDKLTAELLDLTNNLAEPSATASAHRL